MIFQKYLSDDASAAVLDLLPASANGELASVCSWADQLRFRYRWSSPLHFIDTPEVCNYEYSSPHFFYSFSISFPIFDLISDHFRMQEIVTTHKEIKICASPERSTTTPHSFKPTLIHRGLDVNILNL